ncbi:VWA domain-containing protein [Agromyces intestinalis]|uniref:VWA domain-containing protein n=1 Tax=Agromyces intestinalis TaxID=2592652 RepID=A0A5C1YFR2_9MICO|nr:VWA domain-containing protein [Agromyces intestinalis]QEO13602.1 VWA domain-containing protein [Agromyces intestinalis]
MKLPKHSDQPSLSRRERREHAKRSRRRGLFSAVASVTAAALLMLGLPTMAAAEETPVDPLSATSSEATTETPSDQAAFAAEVPAEEVPAEEPPVEEPAVEEPVVEEVPPVEEAPEDDVPAEEVVEDDAPTPQQRQSLNPEITPMFVVPDTSTTAVVNVNLRTLRNAEGGPGTASTAGIQFQLYTDASGSGRSYPGAAVAGLTCTTDADGDCDIVVPQAQTNVRYWAVPIGTTGAASFLSNFLVTGNNTNSGTDRFAANPYAFRTPVLVVDNTYQLPNTGTSNLPTNAAVSDTATIASLASSGFSSGSGYANRWNHIDNDQIASLSNPKYQPMCTPGLKVAIIVDLSTSMVSPTDAGLVGAKAAATAFVNAFAGANGGTGSGVSVSLFTFGTNVPAGAVASQANLTDANKTSLLNSINGLSVSGTQYTNWDRGINQIGGSYDVAVMMTDGNPTAWGNAQQDGSWTGLRQIEEAILSANNIKNQNTQLIAFGVGAYLVPGLPQNLRSVTGPVQWPNSGQTIGNSDFAITSDWATVATQLRNLAAGLTCAATVQVHKQVRGADGQLSNGSGWTFTPTHAGAGTLTPSSPNNGAQATNANGLLPTPYTISFTNNAQQANLTLDESGPSNYQIESVICVDGSGATVLNQTTEPFTLNGLKTGDTITCTVINRLIASEVKVNKQWVVNGQSAPINTHPSGFNATLALAAPGNGLAFGATSTAYTLGQGLTLAESGVTTPAGCTVATSYSKVAGSSTLNGATVANLGAGLNEFTITNTATCTVPLKLTKVVANGPAATSDWTLSASNGGPSGDSGVTANVTPGTTYTLSEAGKADKPITKVYVQSGGWECSTNGGQAWIPAAEGNTVTPQIGQSIECRVTNHTAGLTLTKALANVPDGVTPPALTAWNLTATPSADPNLPIETGQHGLHVWVKPGQSYTIGEQPGGPAGWTLQGIQCRATAGGPFSPGSTVSIAGGQEGACVVTNQPVSPKIRLVKVVVGTNVSPTNWLLSATPQVGTPVGPVAGTTGGYVDIAAGQPITLAESTSLPNAGQFFAGQWSCTLNGGNQNVNTGTSLPALNPGDQVDCTVTNELKPVVPTITKSVVGTPIANANGTWTITYDIVVTNPGAFNTLNYQLEDELEFGSQVDVNSATYQRILPEPAGGVENFTVLDGGVQAFTGEPPLAPNSSHTWRVVVNATVDAGANFGGTSLAQCDSDDRVPGTVGFLNVATLKANDATYSDEACALPVKPTFVKSPAVQNPVVDNGDGTFTLNYTLTVGNPSATTGVVYDLFDTLALPAGTTVQSVSVTGPGSLNPAWTGTAPNTQIANDVSLPGGAVAHIYTVSVVVQLTANSGSFTCPTNGLRNLGQVVSGNQEIDDDACIELTPPNITHTKAVQTAAAQASDGSWSITYRIVVTNSSANGGVYTLADTPAFGAGVNLPGPSGFSVVEVGNPGFTTSWAGAGVILSNRYLPGTSAGAGANVHTFDVTITGITLAGPALTPQQTACPGDTANGAFNNVSSVLTGGVTTQQHACDFPTAPTVDKSGATASQQPDASWNVSYTVKVDNTAPGAKLVYYSLTDTPAFASGVVYKTVSVNGGPAQPYAGGPVTLASNAPILGGGQVIHTLVFNVDVPAGAVSTDDQKCTENGTPGKGFLNSATVTSGAITSSDWDCTSIEEGGTPTVDKHDATAVQGGDGVWTITYTVTVTGNEEFVSTYTLSDTLRFGSAVEIQSASWSQTEGGSASGSWADPTGTPTTTIVSPAAVIGIDEVDEFLVTVRATVPADAFDVPTTNICQPTDNTPNVGFLNEAVLVSGQTTQRDTDCATPAEPEIVKEKVGDTAVWDEAEQAWKATYTVTVHNTHLTQALVYDLDDAPEFTDAVTITDATVTSPDVTVNPAWNGDDVTRVVTDQELAGDATHTYTVTVWFTVDDDVETDDPSLLCEGDDGAKGLLNGAVATSGGTWSDEDCFDVPIVVIVDKEWVLNGGDPIAWDSDDLPAGFTAQGTLDDEHVDWGAVSGPYALGDEVEVDETDVVIPDTCRIVNVEQNGSGLYDLTETVNTFTITNEVECIQTVTLDKVVHNDHGGDADASDWTLSASNAGDDTDGFAGPDSPVDGVGVSGDVELNVGYTLNEVANDTATANGYEVFATWNCSSDTPDAFDLQRTDGSRSAMLTVKVLGADVDCWIENVDIAPKLTLVKVVEPDTIAADFGPDLWTLFANDGDTTVLTGEGTATGSVDANTTYTLGESADFDGMEEFEASVWNCVPTAGGAPVALDDGEITLQPGDDVTCTITNTAKPATYTFDKQVLSTVQNPDGTWTIVYAIDVVNTSKVSPTVYDLTDTLDRFGEGIEIESAGWDGPDADADADGAWTDPVDENLEATLATDAPLPANTTHRYTVTVDATVTAAAWQAEGDEPVPAECTEGDTIGEGGFRNLATLTVDDLPTVATDCDEPARTTFEKSANGTATLIPVGDNAGAWQVEYTLTVTNASEKDLFYDLEDTLGFPEGSTIVEASATTDSGADVSGWNGASETTLVTGQAIAAAGDGATVHTYSITVIVNVANVVDIGDVLCGPDGSMPGQGAYNGAVMTNGTVETPDDACIDIPVGRIKLTKAVDNSAFEALTEALGWTPPAPLLAANDWSLLGSNPQRSVSNFGGQDLVFTVPVGDYGLSEQITPARAAHPLLAYYAAQPWSCDDATEDDAIGSVVAGLLTTCDLVNVADTSDVGIVKEAILPEGVTAVDANEDFEYRLTVTNYGTMPIAELDVTDLIDPQLEITGPATFDGEGTWTETTPADSNAFAAHGIGPFAPGPVTVITIPVRMLPTEPVEPPDVVGPDDPIPTPTPIDLADIPNQACVSMTPPVDDVPTLAQEQRYLPDLVAADDCDTADVPKKAIDPGVYVRCVNDVPWLYYDVQVSEGVEPDEITVTWTSADGSQTRVDTIPWDARSGRLLWPGAAVDENGVPYAFPGWRPVTETDLANPGSVVPGTRYLDLILDETVPTYAWRDMENPATITFSINPSQSVLAVYPQALPSCALDRPPAIAIEKTASVTTTTPGADFSYALNVTSTGIGAAQPVTLFDEIPSHLRVDSITTAGAPTFPRWENCQVTGKDSQGYGGTLRCDLNGVLGQNYTSAPEVKLGVHVRPGTTVGSIVNTGEVCWSEVLPDGTSDPQVVCAEDDVTVGLPRIASTGFGDGILWYAGLLVMLGGLVVTIGAIRRRKGGTVV